jgi:hypothetical protein
VVGLGWDGVSLRNLQKNLHNTHITYNIPTDPLYNLHKNLQNLFVDEKYLLTYTTRKGSTIDLTTLYVLFKYFLWNKNITILIILIR